MKDFQLESIENTALSFAVVSGYSQVIGSHFQEVLTDALADNQHPAGFCFGLTPTHMFITMLTYNSNKQRMQVALTGGRWFARMALGLDEPLLYIGTTSVSVSSARQDVRPNEDPHYQQIAITTLMDLTKAHAATSFDDLVEKLKESDNLVWMQRMHEGVIAEDLYMGTQCLSEEDYDSMSDEEKKSGNKAYFQNNLLNQCFVGISPAIPIVRELSASAEAAAK